MEVLDVKISVSKEDTGKELASNFYQTCAFCGKLVRVSLLNFKSCCNLSNGRFHCPFCLRHDFHHRSARNILILSYRAIVAYFYYRHYLSAKRTMWLTEIQGMVERHAKMGLQSPVYTYDPFTMLWFVDFNKIGSDSCKAPIHEVIEVAHTILSAFSLDKKIRHGADQEIWKKYQEAIKVFYEKRQRPKDRRMLIPTLSGIAYGEKTEFFDQTRDFVLSQLEIC